jgi:hypothetical protein
MVKLQINIRVLKVEFQSQVKSCEIHRRWETLRTIFSEKFGNHINSHSTNPSICTPFWARYYDLFIILTLSLPHTM